MQNNESTTSRSHLDLSIYGDTGYFNYFHSLCLQEEHINIFVTEIYCEDYSTNNMKYYIKNLE